MAARLETGELGSRFLGGQLPQEPADGVGAVGRDDGHAFGPEVVCRSQKRLSAACAIGSDPQVTSTLNMGMLVCLLAIVQALGTRPSCCAMANASVMTASSRTLPSRMV